MDGDDQTLTKNENYSNRHEDCSERIRQPMQKKRESLAGEGRERGVEQRYEEGHSHGSYLSRFTPLFQRA